MSKQAEPTVEGDETPAGLRMPNFPDLDLSELANFIAADHPPPWLADFLGDFVPRLAMNSIVPAVAPSRTKLKKKLDDVKGAIDVLLKALYDNLQLLVDVSQLGDATPREHFRRQLQLMADKRGASSDRL